MKCPIDNETLVMTERSGVEIDYCPKCRGVWLDRGELDKIIERTAGSAPSRAEPPSEQPRQPKAREEQAGEGLGSVIGGLGGLTGQGRPHQDHRGKKKESFLSELFDF